MNVRFKCPACNGSHVFDMPETTIHMTCPQGGAVLKLRLTAGGDVKSEVVEQTTSVDADRESS